MPYYGVDLPLCILEVQNFLILEDISNSHSLQLRVMSGIAVLCGKHALSCTLLLSECPTYAYSPNDTPKVVMILSINRWKLQIVSNLLYLSVKYCLEAMGSYYQ